MSSTVVVRGSGGATFSVDVPTSGPALAQWNEQIVKGDLLVIDEPKVEAPTEDSEPAPVAPVEKPRRGRPPKVKPTDSEE